MNTEFDDIRPYDDSELNTVLMRMVRERWLQGVIREMVFPHCPPFLRLTADFFMGKYLQRKMRQIKTVDDFQEKVIIDKILDDVKKKSTDGISTSGLENLQKGKPYIYISNHRDIVLDSAFLNYLLVKAGFSTVEIAFGDNLMVNDLISDLIRINKSFIVKRNLSPRDQIVASVHLSKYICHTMEKGNSLWIAQRAGRAKNGIDETNPAIIKMLFLSQRKTGMDLDSFFSKFQIVPVAISYELDPCDRMKAWEIHRINTQGIHVKRKNEDLVSMMAGIRGNKGRMHYHFGEPLKRPFSDISSIAKTIDKAIHFGYKLWPTNYIAHDVLTHLTTYIENYTEQEKKKFLSRFKKLADPVMQLVLEAYAAPIESRMAYENTR